jgi:K+-transporting ATPase ATPase A chain
MNGILPLTLVFFLLLFALAWPLSGWLACLTNEGPARLRKLDAGVLRLLGSRIDHDMGWREYALALLAFNALGVILLYALQRLQGGLPVNPTGMGAVEASSAFNTAVSFVTNTNWQGYSGESTMSHLSQMLGLAVQNFLSAATGLAVAFALIRAFSRARTEGIGNFWLDMWRITIYVLLPICAAYALVLVGNGVVQNLDAPTTATTLEGIKQMLPQGPAASQEAIKMLGTNGGGFFNANSAHPFENPTAFTNLLEMLSMFLLPAAIVLCFGRVIKKPREAYAVLACMLLIFLFMLGTIYHVEQAGNPLLGKLGVDQTSSALQSGGNMEGKEVRYGIAASTLFATITTSTSCGAVNAMHDSLTALGGLVPLWLIQLGEVVFGGVGTGFYTIMIYALIGVFVIGLMIGRTPEYLGKKIEAHEIKLASLALLMSPAIILIGTAVAVLSPQGVASMANPGAHGFSEVLYAFSSATNNNGSAFAGLSANTPFYNVALAIAMWFGRFTVIVPVLAIAGSLARKKTVPASAGTLPTDTLQFALVLAGTIVLVGALTFLPALALGPVAEHFRLIAQ